MVTDFLFSEATQRESLGLSSKQGQCAGSWDMSSQKMCESDHNEVCPSNHCISDPVQVWYSILAAFFWKSCSDLFYTCFVVSIIPLRKCEDWKRTYSFRDFGSNQRTIRSYLRLAPVFSCSLYVMRGSLADRFNKVFWLGQSPHKNCETALGGQNRQELE